MNRARLRDLGITIGQLPTGRHNAITDVPGILVGHATIMHDAPRVARTGVTVILPRDGAIWQDAVFGGFHSFNGCGEMTGLPWLEESGMIGTPIAITNTAAVGAVWDALTAYGFEHGHGDAFLPMVAETHDGWLNDLAAFSVGRVHVDTALAAARSGPVDEGNVGGGTGMICHAFKGGIGTSSRLAATAAGEFVVGALVQANYGDREQLRVDGVAVGRELNADQIALPWSLPQRAGSIIVVVATNAPLVADQCRRLARRATVGLARVGGVGHNGSGDLFLAFATGNHLPQGQQSLYGLQMVPQTQIDMLFEAVAEAVEEAILNALVAAETLTGFQGHTAYALPLDALQRIMQK
ncbi:MAG TPA: P1 family peptidase [Roseiflexaceae bacterium]|nr:P1 family peptidase [Roseiflexaceae bacterium]HMP40556.1 P1 family peptidase [Roseiflexaceae bacterium]